MICVWKDSMSEIIAKHTCLFNNIYFDYLLECLTYHRFELWNNMVYKQTEDCNVKVTIRKNSAETIWVFYFYKVYEIKNFVVWKTFYVSTCKE